MSRLRNASFVVAISLSWAGCLEAADFAKIQVDSDPGVRLEGNVRIEARDCVQAGGNSAFQGPEKVGPFDSADQLPEIGNPLIGGGTVFMPGDESVGIWHVSTLCESYTYEGKEFAGLQMGWIAKLIRRPSFDAWGDPRLSFIVADLSFNNQAFVTAAQVGTGGAEISLATGLKVDWLVPDRYLHVVISEANHGTFEFTSEITKQFAEKRTEHIRFWMLPSSDGMHGHDATPAAASYRPISIDVFDTAKPGARKLAGDDLGPFTHLNVPDEVPPHAGNVVGHYWDRFDRVVEIGPAPEGITFTETWLH
jgi:hypothetical protein